MKHLPLSFFLIAFVVPSAFADGVSISRAIPASNSVATSGASTRDTGASSVRQGASRTTIAAPVQKLTATSQNGGTARSVASRTATTSDTNSGVVRVGSRVLDLGGDASQSVRGTTTIRAGGSVSRAAGATHANTARDNLDATVNTVGRNARVQAASINNNPAVRRAGLTLRPSTAEVGGRATIAGTDIQTGSNISSEARTVSARATTNADTITTESIAAAKERMDLAADLNSSCQQQYNDCMDQFCSVIDSNQKRCSCSANLDNYTDVEQAVTNANNQLNEVAQRIRYVGLTEEEIEAIMSATEAEDALSGTSDTTETRNLLAEIEELIRDPASSTSSYASNSSSLFGLDMDIDFTSNSADLFSLDFLNTGGSSLSNMRGRQLYNAAKNRCKTILDQCEDAGANIDQITANYDLAIDRDCIAYEQGLRKMNETLVSNVRSANLMLQQARLAVMQNQNLYDAKECVAALDECMRDDMVCGDDYTKCLDPTKKYIDENGDVVLGQDITQIIKFMENYNNASIKKPLLQEAYSMPITDEKCATETAGDNAPLVGNNGACIAGYLLKKIGTQQEITDEGMCRAVLDKCQAYTYDDKGNYLPYNDIVVNYIQRAMVNIQAAQRQIISDYASTCVLDIANCYNQQVTQVNTWSSGASVNSVYNVMRGACRNVALTCAYAVFKDDNTSCPKGDRNDDDECLDSISEMFYQSLLCPDNSSYQSESGTPGEKNYVNSRCKCNSGYSVYNGQCVFCPGTGMTINALGQCVCDTANGFTESEGNCICPSTHVIDDNVCRKKVCTDATTSAECASLDSCVWGDFRCKFNGSPPIGGCSALDSEENCKNWSRCNWNGTTCVIVGHVELGNCSDYTTSDQCEANDLCYWDDNTKKCLTNN